MTPARRTPWLGLYGLRLIKDIVFHVAIALASGLALFIAVDLVETGNLSLDRAKLSDLLLLELYSIPSVAQQLALVSVVIGTATAIGGHLRRGEMAAFFSSGAGPTSILIPVGIAGVMMGSCLAMLTEWVSPPAVRAASFLRSELGLRSQGAVLHDRQRWFRGQRFIYRVENLDNASESSVSGVLILRVQNGRVTERWDAAQLDFIETKWIGRNVTHRDLSSSDRIRTRYSDSEEIDISEIPRDFVRSIASPERLPYLALRETLQARERVGQPAVLHRLELYRRHTGPTMLIVGSLLSAALMLAFGTKRSLAAALAIGASCGFAAWVLDQTVEILSAKGAVPTEIAAHLPLIAALGVTFGAWAHAWRSGIRLG